MSLEIRDKFLADGPPGCLMRGRFEPDHVVVTWPISYVVKEPRRCPWRIANEGYVQTCGAILCDCGAVEAEWRRRKALMARGQASTDREDPT
jgi:hypothetical protein